MTWKIVTKGKGTTLTIDGRLRRPSWSDIAETSKDSRAKLRAGETSVLGIRNKTSLARSKHWKNEVYLEHNEWEKVLGMRLKKWAGAKSSMVLDHKNDIVVTINLFLSSTWPNKLSHLCKYLVYTLSKVGQFQISNWAVPSNS